MGLQSRTSLNYNYLPWMWKYDSSYQRPYDDFYFLGDKDTQYWNDVATPKYIRDEWNDTLDENNKNRKVSNTVGTFAQILASFFPGLSGALQSLFKNFQDSYNTKLANQLEALNSYRANYYNHPVQQLRRMKQAGINPYVHDMVKNYPYVTSSVHATPPVSTGANGDFLMNLLNYQQRQQLYEARIDNLDSLTAINEYKEQNLLPQLFDKNGYFNSILELQVAWETKNYEYERQLKQNILDANYELALLDTAQGLMETSAQIPGSYVKVDVKKGTLVVQIPDENGIKHDYDLNDLAFDKLPPVLQKSLIDVWSTKQITNSKVQLNTITGNTQSALGGLYNSQKHKVDIYCDTYDETGVWPDEDITLRYAAGILGSKTYWSNWGLNSLDKVFETGLDVGSLYLNPKTALQRTGTTVPHEIPQSPVLTPQPLNIPRGAKPYTFKGQTYWYYPK